MSAEINTFDDNNKTKGGLFFSFIFIALSILYAVFTLINYFKFSTPAVIYFKENEQSTNKTLDMNDPFIFSVYSDGFSVNDSVINISSFYVSDYEVSFINIEKCEFGKNVNEKFKDQLSLSDEMYCISDDLSDHPIFYNSELEYSQIYILITVQEDINYTIDDLYIVIMSSNNIVNHMKNNPLSNIYFASSAELLRRREYNDIYYNFQYIKYESDKGFFFEKVNT